MQKGLREELDVMPAMVVQEDDEIPKLKVALVKGGEVNTSSNENSRDENVALYKWRS